MFLYIKNNNLATNEQEEFDTLKDLLLDNSEESAYQTHSIVRIFEWENEQDVRLGVTIYEEKLEFNFWVEVKSHVAYFGDESKDLRYKEIIDEMEKIDSDISDFIKEKYVDSDILFQKVTGITF